MHSTPLRKGPIDRGSRNKSYRSDPLANISVLIKQTNRLTRFLTPRGVFLYESNDFLVYLDYLCEGASGRIAAFPKTDSYSIHKALAYN